MTCDRCNLKSDEIYKTKDNEYLCPFCCEEFDDNDLIIQD